MSRIKLNIILLLTSFYGVGQPSIEMHLPDGTPILLFQDQVTPNAYYYLPTNLRLSISDQGPEISFLIYSENPDKEPNMGILHMLLVWGLTEEQHQSVNQFLHAKIDSQAYLYGALPVTNNKHKYLQITSLSSHTLDKVLIRSLNSQSPVAISAGSKMAFSFKFSNHDFTIFQKSIIDEKITQDVIFEVLLNPLRRFDQLHPIIMQIKFSDIVKPIL